MFLNVIESDHPYRLKRDAPKIASNNSMALFIKIRSLIKPLMITAHQTINEHDRFADNFVWVTTKIGSIKMQYSRMCNSN